MDELKRITEVLDGAGDDTRMLASVMADVLEEVRKRETPKSAERGGPCWKVPPFVCPVKQTLNAAVRMDGGDVVFPLGYVEADPDAGDLRMVVGSITIERTGKIGQSPRALLFDALRELHLGMSTGFSSGAPGTAKLELELKAIRESLDATDAQVRDVLKCVELTQDALNAILEASEDVEAGDGEEEE